MKAYCEEFNHILIFSGSSYEGYEYIDSKYIHSRIDETILTNFVNIQIKNPTQHSLIIVDDPLGWSKDLKKPIVQTILSTYRHLRISIVTCTQYGYILSPQLRECCSNCCIFDFGTKRALNALYETFAMSKFEKIEDFRLALKQLKSSQHEFLFYSKKDNKWIITCIEPVEDFKINF